MIQVESINKSFGTKKVLNNFSANFESGKVNLIIGKSGSGKTMVVKCMLGLHSVDSGYIYFADKDFVSINDFDRQQIEKRWVWFFKVAHCFIP